MKNFPDPQAIEQQLRTLQHEASPNEARTCLFNLVVFTSRENEGRVMEALNFLHGKRPSRVIKILRNQSGPTKADVTARCVADHEDRGICIQEISIWSGEDGAGEDPGAWGPLLIREIPVIIWWADELPSKSFPLLFVDHYDRVVIDSHFCKDPLHFYGVNTNWTKLNLSDMSWSRILPLMKMTAQAFNPLELRPDLHNLSKITFTGGQLSEVALYFLWIKCKMNWSYQTVPKENSWTLTNSSGNTILFHHELTKPIEKGFTIQFETKDQKQFSIVGTPEGYVIISAPKMESYKSIYRIPNDGECLLKEVDQSHGDRLFLDTLTLQN